MSAVSSTPRDESDDVHDSHDEAVLAGTPVVVRRRAGLAALIGAAASAVAIAYLWRASQTMTPLDWSLCAVMALVAGYYLSALVDARTPLAVADDLGVRIRLGDQWRGLPWDAVSQVSVHPRRNLLRDGRLVFLPHSTARAVEGLEGKAKRHAALNLKMYGAALAVPVGFTTRVSTAPESGVDPRDETGERAGGPRSLVDQLSLLSRGAAEVVEVAARPAPAMEPSRRPAPEQSAPVEQVQVPAPTDPGSVERPGTGSPEESLHHVPQAQRPSSRAQRRRRLGGIGLIVSRVRKGGRAEVEVDGEVVEVPLDVRATAETAPSPADPGETVPFRETRRALRAEVTRDVPATPGNVAVDPAGSPEAARDGDHASAGWATSRVRPISSLGEPVEPLVIDSFVTEPAYDPVIGPELTAARHRVGLSVDELADRTRIRPHVIESIEVDDFTPCGGDFYARGHLRTLARVLGQDPAPLMAAFEDRYATAPVNARRVFEAELATGMRNNMRGGVGGPNWGLLVGVVLCLVLVWGVVRFFSAEPAELVQNPTPVLNGSAGADRDPRPGRGPDAGAQAAEPVSVVLAASRTASGVVVRNGSGAIAFSGELAPGERERLRVAPPVRVRADDAGGIDVTVRGQERGAVGAPGEAGSRTFR